MLNIAETLHRWFSGPRPFAVATVVGVQGSAPLPLGTSLAVDADGHAVGSISGGCVEGAVYELCQRLLQDGGPAQRARFGYSDDDAFEAGLTCGGELDVFVQRVDPVAHPYLADALTAVIDGRPAAVAQVVDGPEALLGGMVCVDGADAHPGGLTGALSRQVTAQTQALLHAGRTELVESGGDAETCPERVSVLVHVQSAAASPGKAVAVAGQPRHRAVDFEKPKHGGDARQAQPLTST